MEVPSPSEAGARSDAAVLVDPASRAAKPSAGAATSSPAPAGAPMGGLATLPASLTIVLPAYNEAERIGPALDELFTFLDDAANVGEVAGLPASVEVLVVDDGSRDGTAAIVAERPEAQPRVSGAPSRLRLVRAKHGGKGAAVKVGMLSAAGDVVIFTDADMATPPDQLPRLVAALGGAQVALGSRIQADGSDMRATQPPYRRFLGRVFHSLASLWVVGPVQDTQCGFKGFTREAARDIFGQQAVTSIVFDVEVIYLARRRGYEIAVVPIRWEDRRGSRMVPSLGLGLRVAWDLARIPFLHRGLRRRDSAEGA